MTSPLRPHPEAVASFIERFGGVLEDSGLPRLAARAFAALEVSATGAVSAADLADQLQVSPAAVSGAVRYLIQIDLVRREREPGTRRDRYVLGDDLWYEALTARQALLERWVASMDEGIHLFGDESPAGARMVESRAFYAFLREEIPAMLDRWRKERSARVSNAMDGA